MSEALVLYLCADRTKDLQGKAGEVGLLRRDLDRVRPTRDRMKCVSGPAVTVFSGPSWPTHFFTVHILAPLATAHSVSTSWAWVRS